MGRRTTVTDEEIFTATLQLISDIGPTVTLADVGQRVGLTSGRLVQRFGTRSNLMVLVIQSLARSIPGRHELDESPLDAVANLWSWGLPDAEVAPEAVLNVWATSAVSLRDAEYRRADAASSAARIALTKELLDEAIEAGELRQCNTSVLADMLRVVTRGATSSWVTEPRGTLKQYREQCVDAVIDPLRTGSPRSLLLAEDP